MSLNSPTGRFGVRPTIVALHASSSSANQWAPLAAYSAPHVDTVAPDLHGHGLGPALPVPDSGVFAADVARVVKVCGRIEGGVHLVGHSYGGATALRVALAMPERVRSVIVYEPVLLGVLRDVYGRRRPAAEMWEIARAVRRYVRAGLREAAARIFIDYWSGAGTWDLLPEARQVGHAARMPVIAAQFGALIHDPVTLDDFKALDVPVLCVVGRRTRPPVMRIAELVAGALPHAAVERVDGLGHMGPVTHSLAFAERAVQFVRRVAALGIRVGMAA